MRQGMPAQPQPYVFRKASNVYLNMDGIVPAVHQPGDRLITSYPVEVDQHRFIPSFPDLEMKLCVEWLPKATDLVILRAVAEDLAELTTNLQDQQIS